MALGQPDPNQGQSPPIGPDSVPTLLRILRGAALKNATKSVGDAANFGTDIKNVLDDPLQMAGVALEALSVPPDMLMSFLKPPEMPPEQKAPQIPIQALLPALTARMGPRGLQANPMGIRPPLPPMPGGIGLPPPGGIGMPPQPPPPVMGV